MGVGVCAADAALRDGRDRRGPRLQERVHRRQLHQGAVRRPASARRQSRQLRKRLVSVKAPQRSFQARCVARHRSASALGPVAAVGQREGWGGVGVVVVVVVAVVVVVVGGGGLRLLMGFVLGITRRALVAAAAAAAAAAKQDQGRAVHHHLAAQQHVRAGRPVRCSGGDGAVRGAFGGGGGRGEEGLPRAVASTPCLAPFPSLPPPLFGSSGQLRRPRWGGWAGGGGGQAGGHLQDAPLHQERHHQPGQARRPHPRPRVHRLSPVGRGGGGGTTPAPPGAGRPDPTNDPH